MTQAVYTGWMSFLSNNQQYQYQGTKWKHKAPTTSSGLTSSVHHPSLDFWQKWHCCFYAGSGPQCK